MILNAIYITVIKAEKETFALSAKVASFFARQTREDILIIKPGRLACIIIGPPPSRMMMWLK